MLGRVVVENGVKKIVPLTADCGSGNPCGAIITVYQRTVPNGYLPLGAQYDITQFPVLYSILGTDTIPTASALGLPTLTTGQYVIKATSGINENQVDNVLSALTPVDTVIVTSGNMHAVTSGAVYAMIGGTAIKYKDIELSLQSLNWTNYQINGTYRGYYINLGLSNYITERFTPICATQWYWTQLARDTPFFVGFDSSGQNLSLAIGDISLLTANTKVLIRVWYITY